MFTNQPLSRGSRLALFVGLLGVGIGVFAGFLVGANPQLLGMGLVAVVLMIWFFCQI